MEMQINTVSWNGKNIAMKIGMSQASILFKVETLARVWVVWGSALLSGLRCIEASSHAKLEM